MVSMPPLQKNIARYKVIECKDCEKRFHASCAKLMYLVISLLVLRAGYGI